MKTLLILISFFITGYTGFSQGFVIDNTNTLHDLHSFETSRSIALGENRYLNIEGSPYLSEEFVKGEVIINDSIRYEMVPLRYNIFTDRMEFLDTQERIMEVNTSIHRFTFHLEDLQFKWLQYNTGRGIRRGMLEILVDGRTRLYRKYTVDIKAGTPPMGYQDAKPDRFIRKGDQFLVAVEDKIPVVVTRGRDIIRKLEEVNPGINRYIKNKRVRINSAQSLIDLVEYANNSTN